MIKKIFGILSLLWLILVGREVYGTSSFGTSILTVSCESGTISVIAHDIDFGVVVNSYNSTLNLDATWGSSQLGTGIIITDTKTTCNDDLDEDGDVWDISIAFGNMFPTSGTHYLQVTGDAGYSGVGDIINVKIEISSNSGSAMQSSHLTQLRGPTSWSVKAVGYDSQATIQGQTIPIISRSVNDYDGAMGIWKFEPSIAIEIPPYIPVGYYQGNMFLYINEG